MPTLNEYDRGDPTFGLPEEDWHKIEATLGSDNRDSELRRRVARALESYRGNRHADWAESPRHGRVRKWLRRVRKDAERLATTLRSLEKSGGVEVAEDIPEDAPEKFAALQLLLQYAEEQMLGSERDDLIAAVYAISTGAEAAMVSLPQDKGGTRIDVSFYGLLFDLAAIYRNATEFKKAATVTWYEDKGVYGGQFFRFVEACLQVLGDDCTKTNSALGKAIQRAVNYRRALRHITP